MARSLFVLLFLVGCASHSSPDAGASPALGGSGLDAGAAAFNVPVSGSRIKVMYLETADGARIPWGFFDARLGSSCYFTQTADAGVRCVTGDQDAGVETFAEGVPNVAE